MRNEIGMSKSPGGMKSEGIKIFMDWGVNTPIPDPKLIKSLTKVIDNIK